MKKLIVALMLLALLVLSVAGGSSAASPADTSTLKGACSGTVACCDGNYDRVAPSAKKSRHAFTSPVFVKSKVRPVVSKLIRAMCLPYPQLECGIWHYVGNGYWMYVPCRG